MCFVDTLKLILRYSERLSILIDKLFIRKKIFRISANCRAFRNPQINV